MSGVVEWSRRVTSIQLQLERVEFDRLSLAGEPEHREAVRRLSEDITRETYSLARSRLAARLETQPLLAATLAPHGSTVIVQVMVVFIAALGGAVFLTRSGVDFGIGTTISAVLCLLSALLMAIVVFREVGRGPMPRFTRVVTMLVAGATVPGLGLAVVTQTLTDPEYTLWWVMLVTSAAIAIGLLVLLARNQRAIGAAGLAQIATDFEEWAAEVRATHAASVQDAALRLGVLWAAVPAERRARIEQERAAAVQVLAERGDVDHAEALRGAVPGALELDRVMSSIGGWGAGSKEFTTATIVPVVAERTDAER